MTPKKDRWRCVIVEDTTIFEDGEPVGLPPPNTDPEWPLFLALPNLVVYRHRERPNFWEIWVKE